MSVSRVLVFLSFLLGVPAFAQFEIAPDHFDAEAQKAPTRQVRTQTKIKAVQTAIIADNGQQTPATAKGSQQQVLPSLQAANAGPRRVSGKTSVVSRKKTALKARTVSALQPVRRSSD